MTDSSVSSQITTMAPQHVEPILAPQQTEAEATLTANLQQGNLQQGDLQGSLARHMQAPPDQPAPAAPEAEQVSKRSLLSYNPTFKAFMDKLLSEPNMEKDSREMSMVKAALFGIKAIEAEALRKNSLTLVDSELQYMKNSLLESCSTYIANRNPWTTRGKERLNMVKALRSIASGEAMSTPALQISVQVAGADVAAKVIQKPDASFGLLKDKFTVCEGFRAQWTKSQKAVLEKIEAYMAKHEEPGVTQIELSSSVKDVLKAFRGYRGSAAEPMNTVMREVREAFEKIVGPVGGEFVPAGAKHVTYDEDAPGTQNMLSTRYESSNAVTVWSSRRDEPLFTKDPAYTDIKQRFLGHCYMLATLGSIARTEPERIREMMHDNGNGTVTVRFHKKVSSQENIVHGQETVIQMYQHDKYAAAGAEERVLCHLASAYGSDSDLASEEYGKWLETYYENSPEKTQLEAEIPAYIAEQTRLLTEAERALAQYEAEHTEEQRLDEKGVEKPEYLQKIKAVSDLRGHIRSARAGRGFVQTRKRELFDAYKAAHPEQFGYIDAFKSRLDALGLSYRKVDPSVNPRFNWDALKEFSQKLTRMGDANPEIKKLADTVLDKSRYSGNRAKFAETLGRMPEDDFQRILAECRTEIQKMSEPCDAFEEMYVTVTKSVPVMPVFGDKHSRDALWVQLLTKAYAASGIHDQTYYPTLDKFSDDDIQAIYVKAKERITSEEGKKPEAQRLNADQIKEKARAEIRQSYAWIEGGYSDDFAEVVTGEVHSEEQKYQKFLDKKLFTGTEASATDQVFKTGIAVALNFPTEDALESQKPARELSQLGLDVLCSVSNAVTGDLEKKVKDGILESITIEDIGEAYMADVSKSYAAAVKEGYVGMYFPAYNEASAEEYRQLFMRRADELRVKLEHYFETHFTGENKQVGDKESGRLAIGHRAFATTEDAEGQKVGVYSQSANTQFEKIRDKLAAGKPVEAGTYSFASGVSSLNGEPKSAGFVGGHAYSVVGVSESDGFKFVELINPHHMTVRNTIKTVDSHGNVSYSYEAAQDETLRQGFADIFSNTNTERTGVFTMEFNDFMNRVSHIYY